MSVRIRMSAGESVLAEVALEDAERDLRRALLEHGTLRVTDGLGNRLAINAAQVLYLQETGTPVEPKLRLAVG